MKKLILFYSLFIPLLIFSVGEKKMYVQVNNKNDQFGVGIAKHQLILEVDSLKFYISDSLFKMTDSMATIFRSGKYDVLTGSGGTIDLSEYRKLNNHDSLTDLKEKREVD